jgi:DNA repair protein RecO (recombination protein O)
MPDFNVQAIVLRRLQYGETDNILTLYSRERGMFSAIAKGARKAVSRLSGPSELLAYSRFSLASAKTLQVVRQAEVLNSHPPFRQNLLRLANGMYIAELLSCFVTDGDADSDLFDIFADGLQYIAESNSPARSARWFELHMLDRIGYAPVLSECTYCGINLNPVPTGDFALSSSQGGVLCPRHARFGPTDDLSHLDHESLRLLAQLSYAATGSPELEPLLSVTDASDRYVAAALRRYIRYRLDRDLRSVVFLDSLQVTN